MRFIDSARRFFSGEGVLLIFVLLISYFTIVHNYSNPPALFWDENYHIASAQKYLNGIYFMEPHPPLGKMVIALGEALLNANDTDDQFIGTDYGDSLPAGFSFAGYRLVPVLLAWLTAPLFFLIFRLLTRRSSWAFLLSFLYIFDNSLLVHLRSAMLESTLLFFCALTLLAFILLWEKRDSPRAFLLSSILFGVAFAGVMTTKLFGLILILLVPVVFLRLYPRFGQMGVFLLAAGLPFLILYTAVWQLHFAIGSTVNPDLPDQGYYQASEQYKQILASGDSRSLLAFPVMLRDSLNFVGHYERGVPRLDLCKNDENGSPFFLWPIGARTINYRWESAANGTYRYLTLVPNPAGWLFGLLGVLLAAGFLLSSAFLPLKERLQSPLLLLTFLGLYCAYMVAISRIDRVMYLYHYFLPLLFTFLLFALVFLEVRQVGRHHLTERWKFGGLLGMATLVFLSFLFYAPLTYYRAMHDDDVEQRALLRLWELKCVNCLKESPLVVPGN